MADTVYTSDVVIAAETNSGEKATIKIDSKGDLQLADSQAKLSYQLMRAISNEQTLRQMLTNSPMAKRSLYNLLTSILRSFKQLQVEDVNSQDFNFSGFSIYRLESGTNATYRKVSTDYTQRRFTDTNLFNGTAYRYAITRVYNNVFESEFTESFSVTPQASVSKQDLYIGREIVAIPGDKQVDFYVVYNKQFKGGEILDDIIKMEISEDANEPRRYFIDIVVKDYNGSQISVASTRRKASV
jgi:hypothetical protein